MGSVGRTVRRSLWEQVPRNHRESTRDLRRRQAVTVTFLVIGALVLSLSLRIDPGNDWFYPATLALAGVWTVGAFASGPLHLGRTWPGEPGDTGRRPFLMPVVYATFGVPDEFIEDIAATQDVGVDKEGFDLAMEAQRGKARAVGA